MAKIFGKYFLQHKTYADGHRGLVTAYKGTKHSRYPDNEGLIEIVYDGRVIAWTLREHYAVLMIAALHIYSRLGRILELLQQGLLHDWLKNEIKNDRDLWRESSRVMVIISMSDHAMYNDVLADWKKESLVVRNQNHGKMTECIWISPACKARYSKQLRLI